MSSLQEITERVREIVADVLALDLEEVRPESRFFEDLGGESIDALDLSFKCEKQFNVKVPLHSLGGSADLATDENGRLTEASLRSLKERLPDLDYSGFEADPLKNRLTELFTVNAIALLIDRALRQQPAPA